MRLHHDFWPINEQGDVKQHLISIFTLANLNKLDPRQTGRVELWLAPGFLTHGIHGEFQADVRLQLMQKLEMTNGRILVVAMQLPKSLDPDNGKLRQVGDGGDRVSWKEGKKGYIRQI